MEIIPLTSKQEKYLKKFRAIFVTDNQVIKIVALTNHYK